MEFVKTIKEKFNYRTLVKQFAIAVGIGALYFAMLVMNPLSALTGIESLSMFSKVRWANLLRPVAMINPSAAFGIAGGAYMFNVYVGKIAFGAYAIMPFLFLGVMLGMYQLSKMIGRSLWKDLFVIILAGFATGILAATNLGLIAYFASPAAFTALLGILISWKVLSHVLVMVIGYFMMIGLIKVYKRIKGE